MPDFSDLTDRKRSTRGELIAARRSRPPATRAAAAAAVQTALRDLVRAARPTTITGYAPMPAEPGGPDLPEALAGALGGEGRLLLPVLLPDLDLDWAEFGGPTSLAENALGPREPVGPRLGRDAVSSAQLLIVPALAVDRAGVRLGRGGGSYDRALARAAPDARIVALLDDGELVDALPAEPHDRRVHAVVTPADGLITLGGGTTGPE
ncbi:5-formyltetrahydrofolate cyclo-ligase [Rhizomonospora bruguierae]|uniref:5-formyltetrahydrofolate cyclo-ligase n=1 Tax=Rhizomonospora bruguierae TaxID=1581705 RepID=UPI001BCBDA56|nr:5-formyltetrahydrofolate cyclo-ligase [Micromonospora sp. NBRC 107566]